MAKKRDEIPLRWAKEEDAEAVCQHETTAINGAGAEVCQKCGLSWYPPESEAEKKERLGK